MYSRSGPGKRAMAASPTPYLDSYSARFSFARGASRANDAGTRANTHREHLFAEVDGLLPGTSKTQKNNHVAEVDGLYAALRYLDKTEGSSTASSPPSLPISPATQAQAESVDPLFEELDSLTPQAVPPPPPAAAAAAPTEGAAARAYQGSGGVDSGTGPQSHDWSSIRHVRAGMELLWDKFKEVSAKANSPEIKSIQEHYEDARGMREASVFAFRNTLTGPPPNDLKSVFAFVSLSYVVSRLLCDKGRMPEEDILAGLRIWVEALPREEERRALQYLASELWPEAKNHLHFINLGISETCRKTMERLQGNQWQNKADPQTTSASAAVENITAWQQPNPSIDTLGVCNVSGLAEPQPQPQPQQQPMSVMPDQHSFYVPDSVQAAKYNQAHDLTNQTSENFNWAQFQYFFPIFMAQTSAPAYTDTGQGAEPSWINELGASKPPDLGSQQEQAEPPPPPPLDSCHVQTGFQCLAAATRSLQNTKLFQAMVGFLGYLGDLPYLLSGRGITAKDLASCLSFIQQGSRLSREIYQNLFDRLRHEKPPKGGPARAILSLASKFLKLGYLQSVSEVKDFMNTFSNEVIRDQKANEQFRQWVQGSIKVISMRKFPCDYCHKRFSRRTNMHRHMKNTCPERLRTIRAEKWGVPHDVGEELMV